MKALHRTETPGSTSTPLRALKYLLSGVFLSLTAALILQGALGLNLILAWLISINVFTFIFFRLDTLNSRWADEDAANAAQNVRIPETALVLLALAGGSGAAIVASLLPPHRESRKPGFLHPYLAFAVGQIIVLLLVRRWVVWP